MAAKHGTRTRYIEGCRCADCKAAEASYRANYRQRKANGEPIGPKGQVVPISAPMVEVHDTPGDAEAGVLAELEGLTQAQARPGLVQAALAMARILDSPKAVNQQPAAAAKLADLLDKLHKGADARKSKLAAVRSMTSAKSVAG